MTVIGSQGFFTSVLSGSLMHAAQDGGAPVGESAEMFAEREPVVEEPAGEDVVAADRPLETVASKDGQRPFLEAITGAISAWAFHASDKIRDTWTSVLRSRENPPNIATSPDDCGVGPREGLLARVREGRWPQGIEDIRSVIALGYLNSEEAVAVRSSETTVAMQECLLNRLSHEHTSRETPTEALVLACNLRGFKVHALEIFNHLMQRAAGADAKSEVWAQVRAAIDNLFDAEAHFLSETYVPVNPISLYGQGGALGVMLPYLRRNAVPRNVLDHVLESGCASGEEMIGLCDILMEQRDWPMIEAILYGVHGYVGQMQIVIRHLLKRGPDAGSAYRYVDLPDKLIDLACDIQCHPEHYIFQRPQEDRIFNRPA